MGDSALSDNTESYFILISFLSLSLKDGIVLKAT